MIAFLGEIEREEKREKHGNSASSVELLETAALESLVTRNYLTRMINFSVYSMIARHFFFHAHIVRWHKYNCGYELFTANNINYEATRAIVTVCGVVAVECLLPRTIVSYRRSCRKIKIEIIVIFEEYLTFRVNKAEMHQMILLRP